MPDSSAVEASVFHVVSPLGEPIGGKSAGGAKAGSFAPAAPIADLSGKRIGLVWSAFKNGNVFLEATERLLAARYRGIEFVRLPAGKGLHWGDHPHESMIDLAKEARLDAAIAAAAG